MSTGTGIEWTDATWNPVTGCTRVSAGCDHCYAVTMTHRLAGMGQEKYAGLTVLNPKGERHFNGVVKCHEDALAAPLSWKKPRRVFVNSMGDLFHKSVPFEFIDKVFAVMALTPRHTYQVLTKRPERMAEYLTRREISKAWSPSPRGGGGSDLGAKWKTPCDLVYTIARAQSGERNPLIWPLPNVWLGTSCENQAAADERIPHLLRCPAVVRFISAEPLLGELDLARINSADEEETDCLRGKVSITAQHIAVPPRAGGEIDWVIVGGESGPGARPCDVAWVRSIVKQCRDAWVPVFVKQLGARPIGVCPCKADDGDPHQGCPACGGDGKIALALRDPKGGDMSEWPENLRVRELPGPPTSVGGSTKAVRA